MGMVNTKCNLCDDKGQFEANSILIQFYNTFESMIVFTITEVHAYPQLDNIIRANNRQK